MFVMADVRFNVVMIDKNAKRNLNLGEEIDVGKW